MPPLESEEKASPADKGKEDETRGFSWEDEVRSIGNDSQEVSWEDQTRSVEYIKSDLYDDFLKRAQSQNQDLRGMEEDQ